MMGKIMGLLGLEEEEELETEVEEEVFPSRKNRNQSGNIISLHSQKNVKVVLQEPRSYEETQEIADHLRSHRPVIVNLQRLSADQARRVVDFLSGCVYALNGDIKKIGASIFLCTPDNIDIQGAITEILPGDEHN
ncbi:cell division protein SepF [Vulcanibacillus modesticaldus]|uniref:Cell division protein SepF n=1 Tax=Vulcanibacillus modesticaldus TaxID=337097 RepID=A0A1D2YV04_9BACI|nr:cell division protein SepF [Vulcanibacillus modesticaldus]OEF99538.1 cell division protein SepF [Vulcanibacillus modesticaldus]